MSTNRIKIIDKRTAENDREKDWEKYRTTLGEIYQKWQEAFKRKGCTPGAIPSRFKKLIQMIEEAIPDREFTGPHVDQIKVQIEKCKKGGVQKAIKKTKILEEALNDDVKLVMEAMNIEVDMKCPNTISIQGVESACGWSGQGVPVSRPEFMDGKAWVECPTCHGKITQENMTEVKVRPERN